MFIVPNPRLVKNGGLMLLLLGFQVAAVATFPAGDFSKQPNIIHIFVDDLGWGGVGFNGAKIIKTPNLDNLAANGLRFTSAYVTYPACAPTRASLLTGFHAGHAFVDRNSNGALRETDPTIAKALKGAGYDTANIGKWGFGGSLGEVTDPHSSDLKNALRSNPIIRDERQLPHKHGYDYFYGYLNHTRAHSYFVDSLWKFDTKVDSSIYLIPTGNSMENGRVKFTHDLIVEQSRQYIMGRSHSKNPFYLQLNFTIPHDWIGDIAYVESALKAYEDSDLPRNERNAATLVTYMDSSIAGLLDLLRDPDGNGDNSDNILSNTVIFFSSDNGLDWLLDEPLTFNGPFRGGKWELFEGGIRVPFFVYWVDENERSRIKTGSTDYATDIADLMPTFLDLAGVEVPTGIDGISLLPVLQGRQKQQDRKFLYFENNDLRPWVNPTRDYTVQHKWAVLDTSSRMKLIYWEGLMDSSKEGTSGYELYDLNSDLRETIDLLHYGEDQNAPVFLDLRERFIKIAKKEGAGREDEFAIEYNIWIGPSDSNFSEPDNWSNQGAPAAHWIASVVNHESMGQTVLVNAKTELLGLEIAGDSAEQKLLVAPSIVLEGRNDINIKKLGIIELRNSTLRSSRKVRLSPNGKLIGTGSIQANLENKGTLLVGLPDYGIGAGQVPQLQTDIFRSPSILITGDYVHSQSAKLVVQLPTRGERDASSGLTIQGQASIQGGSLEIRTQDNVQLEPKAEFAVFRAKTIVGQFSEITLPKLDIALTWDTTRLYTDGVITVMNRTGGE